MTHQTTVQVSIAAIESSRNINFAPVCTKDKAQVESVLTIWMRGNDTIRRTTMNIGSVGLLITLILLAMQPTNAIAERGEYRMLWGVVAAAPKTTREPLSAINNAAAEVSATNEVQASIAIRYYLTNDLSIEFSGTSPYGLELRGKDAISTLGRVAKSRYISPSVMLQWHLRRSDAWVPYVGLGGHFTKFISARASSAFNGALTNPVTKVELDNATGFVAEIGIETAIGRTWFLGANAKWYQLSTKAQFESAGGDFDVDVRLDPLVYALVLSREF